MSYLTEQFDNKVSMWCIANTTTTAATVSLWTDANMSYRLYFTG